MSSGTPRNTPLADLFANPSGYVFFNVPMPTPFDYRYDYKFGLRLGNPQLQPYYLSLTGYLLAPASGSW